MNFEDSEKIANELDEALKQYQEELIEKLKIKYGHEYIPVSNQNYVEISEVLNDLDDIEEYINELKEQIYNQEHCIDYLEKYKSKYDHIIEDKTDKNNNNYINESIKEDSLLSARLIIKWLLDELSEHREDNEIKVMKEMMNVNFE